nr:MAG TPA: hypothetical protein [Caudoviricetes sp.]
MPEKWAKPPVCPRVADTSEKGTHFSLLKCPWVADNGQNEYVCNIKWNKFSRNFSRKVLTYFQKVVL